MGKYTGFKVIEDNNLDKNNAEKTEICGHIRDLIGYVNTNWTYNNFDKNYLAELFVGMKMITLVEELKVKCDNILDKYVKDKRFDEDKFKELLDGEPLETDDLLKRGFKIEDEETLKDFKTVKVYNEKYSQFKKDLKFNYLNANRFERFKTDCKNILNCLGFNKDDVSSFFDASYLTGKKLDKLDVQTRERFDEDFSNFFNKFEEAKLNKQINDLNSARTKNDSALKNEFEYTRNYFYNETRKINGVESKASESDLLVSAISANIEMKKRMSNSTIKKIPILRWFNKEFRKEHKLYKESKEVIENLQGNHNIKGLIENGASIDEIFDEIKQIQNAINENKVDEFAVEEKNNFRKQVFEKDPNIDITKENNFVSNKVEINLDLKETKEASKK